MVRSRAVLQHTGDGPAWAVTRRPLQLLQSTVHYEDSAHVGRSDDWTHRVHTQQELHPQRHKAWSVMSREV